VLIRSVSAAMAKRIANTRFHVRRDAARDVVNRIETF
jgi:hypothetical protein